MIQPIASGKGVVSMFELTILKDQVARPLSRGKAIDAELNRVLESEFFRGSKRSCLFLRHAVNLARSGRLNELKERTLGVELFGRDPNYDTGEDAIVRVKANEIRRRLAQYNVTAGPEQKVRIEFPPGSYVPQFHWIAGGEVAAVSPARGMRWQIWTAAVCLAALLLCAIVWVRRNAPGPVETFWRPVLDSPNPVLICLGHPVTYLLSARVHQRYRSRTGKRSDEGPYVLKFKPNEVLGEDIIPVPDQFLGVGDAQAAFRIGTNLELLGKKSRFRTGYDVSFTDLKSSPIVLIGAYSNRWTMQMTRDLRYSFLELADDRKVVSDRASPGRFWEPPFMPPDGKVSEDYAIVSRIFHSESGEVMILAAGITQYGSQAAGEFLTDPRLLGQALHNAPANWRRMNMQAVLKTRILGSAPAPAEVVATHFW
jgi:hypothetical protein